MVNEDWLNAFPNSTVEFLAPRELNRNLSLMKFDTVIVKLSRPFKLFNHVMKHPGFMDVVKAYWIVPKTGDSMQVLYKKLKRLKLDLKSFSRVHFFNISGRVKEAR